MYNSNLLLLFLGALFLLTLPVICSWKKVISPVTANRRTAINYPHAASTITTTNEKNPSASRLHLGKTTEGQRTIASSVLDEAINNIGNSSSPPMTSKGWAESEFFEYDTQLLQALKAKRSYASIVIERMSQSIDDLQLMHHVKTKYEEMSNHFNMMEDAKHVVKPRIVVLGTGWGSYSFLKSIDTLQYDVTVISPRNYFAFTPMLAASAIGTVEFRSICEPIRNVNPLANYLEAKADDIHFENKMISCTSTKCEGTACGMTSFSIPYDYLLISVGAAVNTFNIPGVEEHCQFLKQVEDAIQLRKSVAQCFERANIPDLSEAEMRKALSFVIVGAGPTGVEFTSELRDWLEYEGRRYYGHLLQYVSITLVEAGKAVLPVFDESLQEEALRRITKRSTKLIMDGFLSKEVTQVKLKSGVQEITDKVVRLSTGEEIPYGVCLWAAGNGPLPTVLHLIDKLPAQKSQQQQARGRLRIDDWCRVHGAKDVYAIGDCAFSEEAKLPATAQVASQQGAYLGRIFSKGVIHNIKHRENDDLFDPSIPPCKIVSVEDDASTSSSKTSSKDEMEYFSEAAHFGELAVMSKHEKEAVEYAKPFQFLNLGVLAYIGGSEALAQISVDSKIIRSSGAIGFLLWRGIYWFKQVSLRNKVLVSVDWIKAKLFGRDLSSIA